jgi:hypothetical protein
VNEQDPTVRNSTLAIISLVSGITGWTVFPFFGAVVAVVTGHMARREMVESGEPIGGKGLAMAGLGLGYGCLFTSLLMGCLLMLVLVFGLNLLDLLPSAS